MLTGKQLVSKGVTKLDASLPEVGMKDVVPSGSWLEQKQIQSALEARKHLVEVERIEKSGALSHASWCDELRLAEVTQQTGGYWQYLGHNVGKKLYLRPEEALFLMEANCLILKHNEVVVSIQKAYPLLLSEPIGIKQYKVYASLSRIGYKVYRHSKIDMKKSQDKENSSLDKDKKVKCESDEATNTSAGEDSVAKLDVPNVETNENTINDVHNNNNGLNSNEDIVTTDLGDNSIISRDTVDNDLMQETAMNNSCDSNIKETNNEENQNSEVDIRDSENANKDVNVHNQEVTSTKIIEPTCQVENDISDNVDNATNEEESISFSKLRLQSLVKRQFKPCPSEDLQIKFDVIPDLLKKTIVTINVPDEQYIPRNVFVNQTKYDLNLNILKSKSTEFASNERPYSTTDEVNAPHIRRLHNSSRSESPRNSGSINPNRNRQQDFMQFRAFNFWRPQGHQNHPFNMFFQRPFPNPLFVQPQFRFAQNPIFSRPFQNSALGNFMSSRCVNTSEAKLRHLQSIKGLAARSKLLAVSGRIQQLHMRGLRRLIDLYNATYNCRIRLTNTFDVLEEANIVETIELNDDEEPKRKKMRPTVSKFDEHLNGIKELALKLKIIESTNGSEPKYRRALSSLVKKFNKSYNAEIYLNKDYEIIDKNYVNLDSSSDSDCIVAEAGKSIKRKKLRNPFNILKKRATEGTSNEHTAVSNSINPGLSENCTTERIDEKFNKNWLPGENDFGRAEVVPKCFMNSRLMESIRDSFIYEFIKNDTVDHLNWPEVKVAYFKYLEESELIYKNQQKILNESNDVLSYSAMGLKPLLRPEDCSDMGKVLERLRIISTNNDTVIETTYNIDFDVYTRDVKNFKKSNPPKPHFRIVCVDESGSFPVASDVATLNLKYEDKIPILFAVVGVGSISYVQVNCIDLPICLPKSDLN